MGVCLELVYSLVSKMRARKGLSVRSAPHPPMNTSIISLLKEHGVDPGQTEFNA